MKAEDIEKIIVDWLKSGNENTTYVAKLISESYHKAGTPVKPVVLSNLPETIERMKDFGGREGCTYSDTEYDSLSAVYGYNKAIEHVAEYIREIITGSKEEEPEGMERYTCTDCGQLNVKLNNNEVRVGFCDGCDHPLWNPSDSPEKKEEVKETGWISASVEMPEHHNKIPVKGKLENGIDFVTLGHKNHDETRPEMYFEIANKSYLTIDVEWLKEQ